MLDKLYELRGLNTAYECRRENIRPCETAAARAVKVKGMGSPEPSPSRPLHGGVAASPGRRTGGGEGDELTSEEKAFLMGEVGEER